MTTPDSSLSFFTLPHPPGRPPRTVCVSTPPGRMVGALERTPQGGYAGNEELAATWSQPIQAPTLEEAKELCQQAYDHHLRTKPPQSVSALAKLDEIERKANETFADAKRILTDRGQGSDDANDALLTLFMALDSAAGDIEEILSEWEGPW